MFSMMALTRWFGVTETDAQRCPARERADIDAIAEKSLLMQANAAQGQHRSLCRGTHAKGVCVRARFEVFDVAVKYEVVVAARLAKGIFAKPDTYPAVVRFGNADSNVNSDFKPDVRSLSFSVDLTRGGTIAPVGGMSRQRVRLLAGDRGAARNGCNRAISTGRAPRCGKQRLLKQGRLSKPDSSSEPHLVATLEGPQRRLECIGGAGQAAGIGSAQHRSVNATYCLSRSPSLLSKIRTVRFKPSSGSS
jgi:hypothetical protein